MTAKPHSTVEGERDRFVRDVVARAREEIERAPWPAEWKVFFVKTPGAFVPREKDDLRELEAELQRKISAYLDRMPKDRAPALAAVLEMAVNLLALRHKFSTIDHRKKRSQIAAQLCAPSNVFDWPAPSARDLALISIVNGYDAPPGWRDMTIEQAINAEADAMRKAAKPFARTSEKK